jgi:magnesium-transporting ATPase (P-type)
LSFTLSFSGLLVALVLCFRLFSIVYEQPTNQSEENLIQKRRTWELLFVALFHWLTFFLLEFLFFWNCFLWDPLFVSTFSSFSNVLFLL